MKTLRQRIGESKGFDQEDHHFYNFLRRILVWEPGQRLTPQQALQDPWITRGLPNEVKQLYTIFNSAEYSKKADRKRSKEAVNAKSQSKKTKKGSSKE